MGRPDLKAVAFIEAAAILVKACSAVDLNASLTEDEESFVREFMRNHIVNLLLKKAHQ